MKFSFSVRPSIISGVFSNLAAGWFGLLLITPNVLINSSVFESTVNIVRSVIGSVLCLLFAEAFAAKGDSV